MACPHVATAHLSPPRPTQSVYRTDCTQCFDSIDDPTGLEVCLSCFNGGCTGERNHGSLHYALTEHPLVLTIKRTKKPRAERDDSEPPTKISKLAIAAETEADVYDTTTSVKCYVCENDDVDRTTGNLPEVIGGVIIAMTFARQTEVLAWEQDAKMCEHILMLQQEPAKSKEEINLTQCADCDIKQNLWMCLQCGNLGCGRPQFGSKDGGNGHGLTHFDQTHHPVSIKLGTISAEGNASLYCYPCDEDVLDPELVSHLQHWHINIAERQKTEKTQSELEVEQNMLWEFSMTNDDGSDLKPLTGPGLTGLKNLGNSCYLASILQCLYSLPEFKERYYDNNDDLPIVTDPASDLETQLRKVGDGLISGRYSIPDTPTPMAVSDTTIEIRYQKGLAPAMLKALIGKGHEEFSTMRQQDAFELLLHLFKLITRSQHPAPLKDPVAGFKFALQQRLQCLSCKKVRYTTNEQDNITIQVPIKEIARLETMDDGDKEDKDKPEKQEFEPVTMKECLDIFTSSEAIEYTCTSCGSKAGAIKNHAFKTFPAVLAINARRFKLINWVPTKCDVPVVVLDTPFPLDPYMSSGLQLGEEELPEDAVPSSSSAPSFTPDAGVMSQLEGMGFPQPRCIRALYNTGNSDADAAMNWLFSHMEDADIDEPLVLPGAGAVSGAGAAVNAQSLETIMSMGLTEGQAKKGLRETGGDVERAIEWIFSHLEDMGDSDVNPDSEAPSEPADERQLPGSTTLPADFRLHSIVCHKGTSIHSGHYVAFIRKLVKGEDGSEKETWVLFNDEKVVEGADVEEMKKFAYVYFFQRV